MFPVKLTPMRWFVVLLIVAYALVLSLSPDPRVLIIYHLSKTSYRILLYSLLAIETLVWYESFFALAKLQEYSTYLRSAKEGRALAKITWGIRVLAFGLIATTIISSIFSHIVGGSPGFYKTATIINNYLGLIVPAVAFTLIGSGARSLALTAKSKVSLNAVRLFGLVFIVLAVFFEHVTLHANSTGANPYFLSPYLLIITVVIPLLYSWFIALLSAYDFKVYSSGVRGLLYKRAFSQLAVGITVAIVGYIALQFVVAIYGYRVSLSPGFIFALLYIILAVFATGFGLMALATKKLKKIEEV